MKNDNFSINKSIIYIISGFILTLILSLLGLYLLGNEFNTISIITIVFITIFWMVILILEIRKKIEIFTVELCDDLDKMIDGKIELNQIDEADGLYYKVNHRLIRLYEIIEGNRRDISKEKMDLQELITDISHQVKTPMANIKMINTTLLENNIEEKKQKEFLRDMDGQLEKLDFLIDSMIKTSRLETGIIKLEKSEQTIYDTLAIALGGILFSAEQKDIIVNVNCPENLIVSHDRKWTSEALFNILDNGIKYTDNGGELNINVEKMEMYIRIDIMDTGKGIKENNHGRVFQRFYREEDVQEIEGVGIGLYLTREIITRQGGYIKLNSEQDKGTIFSIFLPEF